ncbi:hypothetical protein [Burkholderia cepacia]|uniref:hypothetical protein n=1 Tax=Burkholderia cepacia TaxID=292 RepID=UPI00158F034A|nr:hypothetical protein [Burkholderia cepacia]MCA8055608.1 hypothetical protein [Burkholderia cepacia]MCA8135969.1 hypothetical protein [Burkholderia cepacia]MCA8161716.1 hypothetical protein [Burkholderia cepacia]HEM7888311.1 hypothetical protein [Burkholderia cepacia]HEM8508076.1 hypothetical protein [Burkholderia cepacia]
MNEIVYIIAERSGYFLGKYLGWLIYPYLVILKGGAWNIQQSFEGLGLVSSNFVEQDAQGQVVSSYWSPGEAMLPILVVLWILLLVLAFLYITTGYVLARKKGALVALSILLLPGLLVLQGWWPLISLVPDSFVIGGSGVLGSGWGMLTLVGLGLVAGWCGVLVLIDLLPIGDGFGHVYDHVWYAAALLAGIFFVFDSQANRHVQSLQESSRDTQRASAYLLKQAERYESWCAQNRLGESLSCRWASSVQQTLLDYSAEDPAVFVVTGPHAAADMYQINGRRLTPEQITSLRNEIATYNEDMCPVTRINDRVSVMPPSSSRCLRTPIQFCASFPERLDGRDVRHDAFNPASLASECVVSTLVAFRDQQEKLLTQVNDDRRSKHYRWIYYVLFSIVIGGKIALATAKTAGLNKRTPTERRRSLHWVSRLWQISWRGLQIIWWVIAGSAAICVALLRFAMPRSGKR